MKANSAMQLNQKILPPLRRLCRRDRNPAHKLRQRIANRPVAAFSLPAAWEPAACVDNADTNALTPASSPTSALNSTVRPPCP